jgi:acyl-coenzyme A synthetase/AMP-(fatty) acid ligase
MSKKEFTIYILKQQMVSDDNVLTFLVCARVIHEHGVNAMFTAPTALRVIKRADPEVKFGSRYSTKS